MKALTSRVTNALDIGAIVKCDDNSGAKKLRVLSARGYKGRRKRRATVKIGDIFSATVVEGKIEMRKKIVKAVLVRQRKPYRRSNGDVIRFEDNAAILITDKNEPQASEIKGVIAKEAAERFPKIPTIARNVI